MHAASSRDDQTAVIGAGVAGLAAAGRIAAADIPVTVVEARGRVGGRIETVRLLGWPVPIEAGAEFIHGRPQETWAAVRAANLAVYEVSENHWDASCVPPRSMRFDQLWTTISERMRKLSQDLSFASFLERDCSDLSADERDQAIAYVEGFNAADSRLVSCRWLVESEASEEQNGGEQSFRLAGGYDRLVEWLLHGIGREHAELRLSTVVNAIRWRPGEVEVAVASAAGMPLEPIRAARAIITLPWGVLRAPQGSPGAVRFIPDLSNKWKAAESLRMGSVVKLVLRFRRAFWEDTGKDSGSGLAGFLHSPHATFPTWWTTDPVRTAVLTAWAGGPAAERLSGLDGRALAAEAVDSLARMLAVPTSRVASLLDAWHVTDWLHDPFSRGAYSYVAVGDVAAPHRLADAVEDTLFFAGEATDERQEGTVAGALASGYRAADEVCRAAGLT